MKGEMKSKDQRSFRQNWCFTTKDCLGNLENIIIDHYMQKKKERVELKYERRLWLKVFS